MKMKERSSAMGQPLISWERSSTTRRRISSRKVSSFPERPEALDVPARGPSRLDTRVAKASTRAQGGLPRVEVRTESLEGSGLLGPGALWSTQGVTQLK